MTAALSAELPQPAPKRKSVPLTEESVRDLDLIKSSPVALASLGLREGVSEAALLQRLVEIGLGEAREVALDTAYQALAVSYVQDPAEASARAAMRSRRHVRDDVDA